MLPLRSVYAVDLRGHGKATGERLYVDKMTDFVDDAGFVCESFAHEVPAPDFALAILDGLSRSSTTRAIRATPWPRWCAPTNGSRESS